MCPTANGSGLLCCDASDYNGEIQDTMADLQTLYNGRVWKNLYYKVKEDQFLFSSKSLPGSVSISGRTFKNLEIRYDIYSDEIIIPKGNVAILQLNKERVDSFDLYYNNTRYLFVNIKDDSIKGFTGYLHLVYNGKTPVYIKYKKEIALLAVDGKYDSFYETRRLFIVKDSVTYPITGRRGLFNMVDVYKPEIKSFIKKNKLQFSVKDPSGVVPIIKYFDSIR